MRQYRDNTLSIGKAEKAAVIAIVVGAALFVIKYLLAGYTGSMALKADAWHSVADVLISLLVLIGVVLSRKGWRLAAVIENIIALIISGSIFTAAYFLARESLKRTAETELVNIPVGLAGVVLCALIAQALGHYKIRVGKEEDSVGVLADGHHSIMDFYTTVVAGVGLLGQMIGLKLDSIASIIVVVFVVQIGIKIGVIAIQGLIRDQNFSTVGQSRILTILGEAVFGRAQKFFLWATGREVVLSIEPARQWLRRRWGSLAIGAIFLAVGAYLFSGFYAVEAQSTAIVTVFGKAKASPFGPGLHYAPPFPIGRVYKVETGVIRRAELGFTTNFDKTSDWRRYGLAPFEWHSAHTTGYYKKNFDEAIMLTGDENMIDINAVVHYKIADPHIYLFGLDNQEKLIKDFTENVLRLLMGRTSIDEIFADKRKPIQEESARLLQRNLDAVGAGAEIVGVELQDVHPPVSVVRAFRDVATAKEEKDLTINNAVAEQNEKIPQARAAAVGEKRSSEAYMDKKMQEALGQSDRFRLLFEQYRLAKEVTAHRLYLETVEKALSGKRKFIVSPGVPPKALDLRFLPTAGSSSSDRQKK
jgi:modulator of FtsH protease HflK